MGPNRKWSISYSWSQPYGASSNPFYSNTPSTQETLARLEMVDRWVDSMLTYPDAERILNKITQQGDRDV